MTWVYNDGGRKEAGFQGDAGDCVCRALTITSGLPYRQVYDRLALGQKSIGKAQSARNGVNTRRKWFKDLMIELGYTWVPTMQVGQGCTTHLKADELPPGKLVVRTSKHLVAVVDGTIHDTYDPSRDGTRCVYGYWMKT